MRTGVTQRLTLIQRMISLIRCPQQNQLGHSLCMQHPDRMICLVGNTSAVSHDSRLASAQMHMDKLLDIALLRLYLCHYPLH